MDAACTNGTKCCEYVWGINQCCISDLLTGNMMSVNKNVHTLYIVGVNSALQVTSAQQQRATTLSDSHIQWHLQ